MDDAAAVQTSASQAGILFGNNDDIPAFRWYDKATKSLFVSNRAADAEQLEQRLIAAGHKGLLERRRREHRQPVLGRRAAVVSDD